ncbi:MAG: hypothetical protein COU22_00345 [Candidatus Komeilibacteria bacterium CG10_big_fil_rev_8_21_14_0_10_41_13]|uniref:Uncharacterized protein n=1 Tax=Candidatus Komeilibacteria bacterium CG10_big_fil_rev_8_21_14_0_10_41_13 TaxID=1974476 RepID=A0A2M6WD86_9BACT|nr:MAG: hypothetical protein COU22_00345 [Candidatus Komeilibacteria bacterium CG10_big_fil_rev_8_21_14_0_10_41_13]
MQFKVPQTAIRNIRDDLRRCGYFSLFNRHNNAISYVRRLSKTQHYPRFHLYLNENPDHYIFNLHLDQKQVSYAGSHAHSGEYEDPVVDEEANRIKEILNI